jgi:CheY-like chemotaxis protein
VQLLRLQQNEDPLQRQGREIIERQIDQLTRLVDDLLEASRVTTGRIRLQRERLDLRGGIERAVETVRPLIALRRHELSVSLPSEAVWLFADATRMEQVFVNLLTNAAKYTDEGGRIWLKLDRVGQEATLCVRDNGVGIAPELLPNVFDLFTQATRSPDRSQGGLGVGLTIVRRVVELHGGTVEAASAGLGQGSEFVMHLPLTPPPELSAEPLSQPKRTEARLRVLVVDDNNDAADSVALLLRHAGHEVRAAYTGHEALDAAMAYRPDAVLLDLGLPEIDGYEVARRLRKKPEFSGVFIIALSGYGQESDRRRSREAGCDAHLVKPAELKKIEEVLGTLVRSRS